LTPWLSSFKELPERLDLPVGAFLFVESTGRSQWPVGLAGEGTRKRRRLPHTRKFIRSLMSERREQRPSSSGFPVSRAPSLAMAGRRQIHHRHIMHNLTRYRVQAGGFVRLVKAKEDSDGVPKAGMILPN